MNKLKMRLISKIIGDKACVVAVLDEKDVRIHTKGNALDLMDLAINTICKVIENQVAENNRKVFWEAVRDYADKKASAIAEEH